MRFLSSISIRLLAGFVVVMALAATLLLSNLQSIFRSETLRRATLYHEEVVSGESLKIGNAIYEGGLLAMTLAQQAELRQLLTNPNMPGGDANVQQRLRNFLDRNRGFSGVALIGSDYSVITRLAREYAGTRDDLYWESFFRSGLDPFNSMAKIPVFMEPVKGSVLGAPSSIRYTIPLFDEDNLTIGILALDYQLQYLINTLDIATFPYVYFILDDRGTLLAGQDPLGQFGRSIDRAIESWSAENRSALARTRKGHFIEQTTAGQQLVVFSRLIPREQTGLHVTLAQAIPLQSIYEPVRLVNEGIAISIIVTFLLALIMLAAYSHRLVVPLQSLASIIRHYKPGKPVHLSIGRLERSDEIGHLCRAFHRMSAELEQAFEERDARYAELQRNNRLLEQKTVEAHGLAKAKSDFLAIMSHEIRTPINAIVGYSQLLREETDPDEVNHATARIMSNSRRLLQLIDNILDFTRIQSGHSLLKPEIFNPMLELQTIEECLSAQAAQKSLTLSIEFEGDRNCNLYGDVVRLRQILNNLVGNALKFTDKGTVEVKARLWQTGDLIQNPDMDIMLTVKVQDTGIGIPVEKQALIFRPFEQMDSTLHRRYEGTGLGLAICDRLVRLMGGRIDLDSTPGKGSCFMVSIPFRIAEEGFWTPAAESPVNRVTLGGLKFLVIEDDPINAEVLQKHLMRNDAEIVDIAFSQAEVERKCATVAYDLIFMDLHLGGEDGSQLTRKIRAGDIAGMPPPGPPIIVFTAFTEPEFREEAYQSGAQRFFTKPTSMDELLLAIAEILELNPANERV